MMAPTFRVYTNPDIVGVELGGALKNIIALGTGISDGLGFGDNTKAALMTRGLAEITRLGVRLGANPLTFAGLAGVGDLIVTCTSWHSRNRRAGVENREQKRWRPSAWWSKGCAPLGQPTFWPASTGSKCPSRNKRTGCFLRACRRPKALKTSWGAAGPGKSRKWPG
jgi:hypothetical protein